MRANTPEIVNLVLLRVCVFSYICWYAQYIVRRHGGMLEIDAAYTHTEGTMTHRANTRTRKESNKRFAQQTKHSPAHHLVRQQDAAHFRILVLSLVDDGLPENTHKHNTLIACILLHIANCQSATVHHIHMRIPRNSIMRRIGGRINRIIVVRTFGSSSFMR